MKTIDKNKRMIRTIIILLFIHNIGYSQNSILNLKYSQEVLENGKKVQNKKRGGIINVFNPSIFSMIEASENMNFNVQIQDEIIYVQSQIKDTDKIFSTKYQMKDEVYHLNLLTGEQKKINYKKRLGSTDQLFSKLKKKKSKKKDQVVKGNNCQIEIYKSKIEQKEMHLSICKNITIDQQTGLFNTYFYKGKLIVEKKIIDKAKGTEVILKLVSIDTLSDSGSLTKAINADQELVISNENIEIDSVNFSVEIPDIYYKDVADENIVSLKKYKGNGKYLMIDFWGTWCKPCLASIPELREFYEKYSDKIDLLSMDYKDSNITQIRAKIKETGMYWPQGIATEKVNRILNPQSMFPGIIIFDDEMKLILRNHSKEALKQARILMEQ